MDVALSSGMYIMKYLDTKTTSVTVWNAYDVRDFTIVIKNEKLNIANVQIGLTSILLYVLPTFEKHPIQWYKIKCVHNKPIKSELPHTWARTDLFLGGGYILRAYKHHKTTYKFDIFNTPHWYSGRMWWCPDLNMFLYSATHLYDRVETGDPQPVDENFDVGEKKDEDDDDDQFGMWD